jgi:hypothetical protein
VPGDVARVRHEVEDDVPEMVLSRILDGPLLEFPLVTPAEGEARHLPQPDALSPGLLPASCHGEGEVPKANRGMRLRRFGFCK